MINSMMQQAHYFSSQLFFNNNFIWSVKIIILMVFILFLMFAIQLKREKLDDIANILSNILIILGCFGIMVFFLALYFHSFNSSPYGLAITLLLIGICFLAITLLLVEIGFIGFDKDIFQSNVKTNIMFITCIILITSAAIYSMGSAVVCFYSGFCESQTLKSIKNHTNLTYQFNSSDGVNFFCQSGNHYYYVGTINQNHSQIIPKKHNIKSSAAMLLHDRIINISPQFKELTQTVNKPQVRKYFRVNDDSKNVLSVKHGQLILTNVSKTQGKNAQLVLNDTQQKVQSGFKTHATKQKVTKNITLYIAQ